MSYRTRIYMYVFDLVPLRFGNCTSGWKVFIPQDISQKWDFRNGEVDVPKGFVLVKDFLGTEILMFLRHLIF